jgi:hypothetical protein
VNVRARDRRGDHGTCNAAGLKLSDAIDEREEVAHLAPAGFLVLQEEENMHRESQRWAKTDA